MEVAEWWPMESVVLRCCLSRLESNDFRAKLEPMNIILNTLQNLNGLPSFTFEKIDCFQASPGTACSIMKDVSGEGRAYLHSISSYASCIG
ncbi:hypothetical protein TNCV_2454761 [Trichonephila clavipes]|nr:hypothetical protein TNCV_2454761 [Trichonephila clavipes]